MISTVLLYLISFLVFVLLQALCINGIYESLKGSVIEDSKTGYKKYNGMILYMIAPSFFEKHRQKYWSKVYTCVRCMAGWAGTLTFWIFTLPIFGFYFLELSIWLFDIFILVALNFWVYNKS